MGFCSLEKIRRERAVTVIFGFHNLLSFSSDSSTTNELVEQATFCLRSGRASQPHTNGNVCRRRASPARGEKVPTTGKIFRLSPNRDGQTSARCHEAAFALHTPPSVRGKRQIGANLNEEAANLLVLGLLEFFRKPTAPKTDCSVAVTIV